MNKKYQKTINTYEKLGKEYLEQIKNYSGAELNEFIKIINKNSLVLDVGCAGGRDSKIFLESGHKIIGIDIVDEFIKYAKKENPAGKFLKMDLLELNFPNNYFEAIWAQAVLLHFTKKDVIKITKKLYKILKPNGKLHIRVKYGKGEKLIKEKNLRNNERFCSFFNKKELEDILKQSKFKIIRSEISTPDKKDQTKWNENMKWINVWCNKTLNEN